MTARYRSKKAQTLSTILPGRAGGSLSNSLGQGQGINRTRHSSPMMGAQTDAHPEEDTAVETAHEEPWTILVHNDDVTPYDFVIDTLGHIFSLSSEIAETVTWEAHSKGVAPVCSRPQSEAKRLISDAHSLARSAGYPLTFSMEPKS